MALYYNLLFIKNLSQKIGSWRWRPEPDDLYKK